MNEKPNLHRLTAEYMLTKLTPALRAEIIAEGAIATTYGISFARTLKISEKISVDRHQLFQAFRNVVDEKPVHLIDVENTPVDANFSLEENGQLVVEVAQRKMIFNHA